MATPEVLNPRPPNYLKISKRESWQRYVVLAAACCGTFVGFGSLVIFTFGVFLKPLTASFGWTRSQVSLAFTLTALTVAVCSPVIGRLLDRFPARRVIIPCTIIYGLAFASLGLLTPKLGQFYAVFFLLGIIGNGTTQLGYARVVSTSFHRSRGCALAAVMTGSATGSMVFPPLAQWLISGYGWRTAYAALGALVLLIGLPLTIAFLREADEQRDNSFQFPSQSERWTVWKDLRSAPFLYLTGGLVLFSIATNGLEAHLAPLLTDRGFAPAQAAAVLSAAGFTTLASRLATGYLLDRFVASRVAAALFIVCAAGFLLIVQALH